MSMDILLREYAEMHARVRSPLLVADYPLSETAQQRSSYLDSLMGPVGLAEEAGEVLGLFKKSVYHGHGIDTGDLTKELGDVFFYFFEVMQRSGIPLSAVIQGNIDKLNARYPNGFSTEASIKRADEASESQHFLRALDTHIDLVKMTGSERMAHFANLEAKASGGGASSPASDEPGAGLGPIAGIPVGGEQTTMLPGEEDCNLTRKEELLYKALWSRRGHYLSRAELAARVGWDAKSNSVGVYISYLRKKLGASAIVTVRGKGYGLRYGHFGGTSYIK